LKDGAAWLIGAHFSPTIHAAASHLKVDPVRTRKLLLHSKELATLFRSKDREGYTVVPLNLHWKRQYAKITIGLAKGKQKQDKREASKKRDWGRERNRMLKKG
ncbi:MAG: SsrA-binding protein, partial [Coxiella sp. (in: Bacteria)]